MKRSTGLNNGYIGANNLSLSNGVLSLEKHFLINATPFYPLDLVSSANLVAAWSTRKLKNGALYANNVRRSNDNSTTDIGFSSRDYNVSALNSHVGANSGFVTTWYDQSGNNKNLTQTNSGNQPRIVNAGTNETINSKVAVKGVSSSSTRIQAEIGTVTTTTLTVILVCSLSTYTNFNRRLVSANYNDNNDYGSSTSFNINHGGSNSLSIENSTILSGSVTENTPVVISVVWSAGAFFFRKNGVQIAIGGNGNTIDINKFLLFGQRFNQHSDCSISECVFYSRALNTTELQSLERNMGEYYSIAVA